MTQPANSSTGAPQGWPKGATPADGAIAFAQGYGEMQNPFERRSPEYDRWAADWRWQHETTRQKRTG
jgi:hypothetical protein